MQLQQLDDCKLICHGIASISSVLQLPGFYPNVNVQLCKLLVSDSITVVAI